MRITPSDINKCHCYQCGKNLCDPTLTENKPMYRIRGVEGNQINYITATVDLPICEECNKKSKSAKLLPIVLFVFLVAIYVYCLITGGMGFWKFLLCIGLTAIVCVISYFASNLGLMLAYEFNFDSDYGPIKIMKEYGWQESAPQKVSEFKSEYNEAMHIEMIGRIVTECDCNIE